MKTMSGLFLVLALQASMVFAGGNAARRTTGSGARPDVLKLTIDRPIFTQSPRGTLVETVWRDALQKYMGMPLELTLNEMSWGDFNERQDVYLAAGDWADIFLINRNINRLFDLGSQGMIVNLKEHPNETRNFFTAFNNPSALGRITAPDGGVYGFNSPYVSTHNGTQEVILINVDAFKKHNIRIPETMDELYQAAKQLKALYPASYPINGNHGMVNNNIIKAFKTSRGLYYNGSKFVYGNTEPAFRQALEYYRKLYAERLLDPEWFTDSYETQSQKMYTGRNFISYGYILDNMAIHTDITFGLIPYMSADGSTPFYPNDNVGGLTPMTNYNIVVNAKTMYPDLALKVVDFQYSPEMMALFNWGVEGTTYTFRADGSKQFVPEIMNAEVPGDVLAKYGINTSYSVRSGIQLTVEDRDVSAELSNLMHVYLNGNFDQRQSCWKYYDGLARAGKARQFPVAPSITLSDEERDITETIITAVDTLAGEYWIRFITGEVSLDQWDRYLSDLKAAGDIDRVLAVYNSKL